MTTEIDVKLSIPIINPEVRTKMAKRFNEIHDQTFMQTVNYTPQKDGSMKGETKAMEHSPEFIWVDSQFFYIPCHWSYEHAIETQINIKQVLKEFGMKGRTRVSY